MKILSGPRSTDASILDATDLATVQARHNPRPYLPLAAFALVAGFAALMIDLPLARWCAEGHCPGDLERLFHLAEAFSHGAGVAIILLSAFLLDPRRRWAMPRLACIALSAGLLANVVKMTLSRSRPRAADLDASILDTFGAWFPLTSAGSNGQGLPSAHTATAFALAVGLIWLYPRGRWLFPTLAVLAGFQRIVGGSHFLSDVLWGSVIGWVVGVGFTQGWLSPGWLNRLEEKLTRKTQEKWPATVPESVGHAEPQHDAAA